MSIRLQIPALELKERPQRLTELTAEELDEAFMGCIEFLWNRTEWDNSHKWLGPNGYINACDNVIADIRAFEARGHQFEPPSDEEWDVFLNKAFGVPHER
jgi:hypothetical protein